MSATLTERPIPKSIQQELDHPLTLDGASIAHEYRERGFVVLRDVFSRDLVTFYREVVYERVQHLSSESRPLNERSGYNRAFLQVSNLWKQCPTLRALILSTRVSSIVAATLAAKRVRLWNDHALYKEPGGGPTFLHTDWNYIPIVEDAVCAMWIPLQDTPKQMGSLQFIEGSHRFDELHGCEVTAESDAMIRCFTAERELKDFATDFAEGDISIHNVRTAHWAPANTSGKPRSALSLFYCADGCRFTKEPFGKFQTQYWDSVLGGAENAGRPVGGPEHPLL